MRPGSIAAFMLLAPLGVLTRAQDPTPLTVHVVRDARRPTFGLLLDGLREARPRWTFSTGPRDGPPGTRPGERARRVRLALGDVASADAVAVSLGPRAPGGPEGLAAGLASAVRTLFPELRSVAVLDPDRTLAGAALPDPLRMVPADGTTWASLVDRAAPRVGALVLADGPWAAPDVEAALAAARRHRLPVVTTAPWIAPHRVTLAVVPDVRCWALRVAVGLERRRLLAGPVVIRSTVNLDRVGSLRVSRPALVTCDRILGAVR